MLKRLFGQNFSLSDSFFKEGKSIFFKGQLVLIGPGRGDAGREGGVEKPLHRYKAHKHWVFLIFNPLHKPLQGAAKPLQEVRASVPVAKTTEFLKS